MPITLDGSALEATPGTLDLDAPIVLNQVGGTVNTDGLDVGLDGPITGDGSLTTIDSNAGSGTLIVTAANTFSSWHHRFPAAP